MQIPRSKHKWTYVVIFKLSFIAIVSVLFETVVYLVLKETIKKFNQCTFFPSSEQQSASIKMAQTFQQSRNTCGQPDMARNQGKKSR